MTEVIFLFGLLINMNFLIVVVVHALKKKRFWPSESKNSWQNKLVWWSVRLLVLDALLVSVFTWNNLLFEDYLRFYIALPISCISLVLASIGFRQLGWENTHGEAKEFVTVGLYRFSRNPQYVLYSISFLSFSLVSSSWQTIILFTLLTFWYMVAPFAEETWLEQQYGASYTKYKNSVPRYVGWQKNA